MAATKGNQFWKKADPKKIGRPTFFNPTELWELCAEYFQYQDDNPIITEEKTVHQNGKTSYKQIENQRPYTWKGLYVFIGVANLNHYKKKEEFSSILEHVDNIIYSQKFDGASVGIFSATIIARDLGLTDKQQVDNNHSGGVSIIKRVELPDNGRMEDKEED
jgi:hypothetical protein